MSSISDDLATLDDALATLSRIVGESRGPTTGGWYAIQQAREVRGRVEAELSRLREERDRLAGALKAICTSNDSGTWIEVYRKHGGGYEGLQAIAESALREEELRKAGGVW